MPFFVRNLNIVQSGLIIGNPVPPAPPFEPVSGSEHFESYSVGTIEELTYTQSWNKVGSIIYWGNHYGADHMNYSVGAITGLSNTLQSWLTYTGSFVDWSIPQALDSFGSYPTGSISSLSNTSSWNFTGSIIAWAA